MRKHLSIFTLVGASLLVPTALFAGTTALVGGQVHTVGGETLTDAVVLIEDGKIVAVGSDVPVPADADRVDVSGRHVYPGMIAANTSLGLTEIGSVRGTLDMAETGNINPNARAKYAINADSELIPVARANGILTVLSATSGGVLSGTSVIWNLDGWNWEDLTVREPAALHLRWPSMTFTTSWWNPKTEEEQKKEREKALEDVTEAFDNARAYMKAREASGNGVHHKMDVRWEAMIPALRKEMPVFVHADEYQQIEGALDFAKEQDLEIVLVGGRDSWRLVDRLAAEGVPVILESVVSLPRRSWEPYDATFTVPRKLHEAGVQFCISYGGAGFSVANLRNLPYQAAMAAAYGLPREEALRSVTLYPAQILGIDDRMGSIEVGKDANLIVTDGDPLEIRSHVLMAWIEGRPVDLGSRHTRLYDRYRNRPRRDDSQTQLEPAGN